MAELKWRGRPTSTNIEDRRGLPPQLYSGDWRPTNPSYFTGPPAPVNVIKLKGGPGAWRGDPLPPIEDVSRAATTAKFSLARKPTAFPGNTQNMGGEKPTGLPLPGAMNFMGAASATDTATRLVNDLMRELDLTREQAMGLVGNLAHESGGFKDLTENGVAGRGGYGYAQWTGPRRTKFESYATEKGLDPSSYEANLGFIVKEMRGPEKSALRRIKKATTTEQAATTAMNAYFRPGVPHLDSRKDWAGQFDRSISNDALSAINSAMMPAYQTQGGKGAFKPPTLDEVTAWDEKGYKTPIQTVNFDRMVDKDPYGIGTLPKPYGPPKPPETKGRTGNFSTETRYAAGAGKGAKVSLPVSPVRVAASAQGSAGTRNDVSGSATLRAPSPTLTSRPVTTVPILPSNTRVPTTQLEQLQLATERLAAEKRANVVGTPKVASLAGVSGSGSGSVTYTPPRAPVSVSASATGRLAQPSVGRGSLSLSPSSSGVGGAGQVGTNRMAAAEPSIMPQMREQMAAALPVPKASVPSVPVKTATRQPTQAQLQAIRDVPPSIAAWTFSPPTGDAKAVTTPNMPKGSVLTEKSVYRLPSGQTPMLGSFDSAAVDKFDFNDMAQFMKPTPQVASVPPMPRPRPMTAPAAQTPVGPLELAWEAGEASAQNMANSSGRPVRAPSGKVYQPMAGLGPPQVRPQQQTANRGGGLWGGIFNSVGGQPSVINQIMSGTGNASLSFGNPGYTTTPFQEDRFQTTTGAVMPASMDNDRWRTGY